MGVPPLERSREWGRVMARRLAGRYRAVEIGWRPGTYRLRRRGRWAPITAYGFGALGNRTLRARSS
ncbi:hypothetical protein GCM10023080_041240 [Streptomyces pseudoechinosporeus]